MIQDILPLHLKNQYEQRTPDAKSRIIAFADNSIFVKKGEETDYLTYEQLRDWCSASGLKVPDMVYLLSLDEQDYFLTNLPKAFEEKEPYEFVRMFQMRGKKKKEQVFVAATAWHLYRWYLDNQYCGRCAKKLQHSEKMRMLFCPCCNNQVFPKIAPAVIVGVTNGEYILMTKYANREYKRYALIAGFTEIGETAEKTVQREVLEEVGLHVKNIQYYKSQPWGFDSNLLLGYFCELDDESDICLDEEELAMAEWVHYRDIPQDTEGLSLTHEMMSVFRERCERKSDLSKKK